MTKGPASRQPQFHRLSQLKSAKVEVTVTFRDMLQVVNPNETAYSPKLEGVAPATPRNIESARQEGSTSSPRAGRQMRALGSRAARDTCAPRALIRTFTKRNPLTAQRLQSCSARDARRSRDTSAARRLSNEFSFLLTRIGSCDQKMMFAEAVNTPPPVVHLRKSSTSHASKCIILPLPFGPPVAD